MADLTPLDEKLGEVLGLAQAAQDATEKVGGMEGADAFRDALTRMHEQAEETERRTDELVDALDGRKTAIREKARETKGEATEMMKTYLGGEEEALDGFEFLSMAEAGGVCHGGVGAQRLRFPRQAGGGQPLPVGDREEDRRDRGGDPGKGARRLGGRRAAR